MAGVKYIRPSRLIHCTMCEREMQRSRSSSDTPICRECRALRHGTSTKYRAGCRCGECVEYKRSENRSAQANRDPRRRYKVPSVCKVCAMEFMARTDGGGFCSVRCGNIAKNDARGFVRGGKSPRKPEFRRRAERVAKKAAEGSTGKGMVWVQGDCAVCGTGFLSPGLASRYCSRECRVKNRQRSFGLSWLDRVAIFERDDWKCQICMEPVDYSADPLSDWYPSLDHVVPRSQGGADDESNLRCAHRWCNSVRGDLTYYTDADLAA